MFPMQQTPKTRTPEEAFGRAVGSFRTVMQMSQRDFAAKLTERGMPVDASAVSRIEKGSRSVRLVEAITIAEVLQVDLDFLVSGAKSPLQQFQTMRRRTDMALQGLVEPIVEVGYSLWEVYFHLQNHPELLETLEDKVLGRPKSLGEYLEWVAGRAERWEVPEEDYIIMDSEEEAEQMIAIITRLARMHIGTEKEFPDIEGGDDGEHSEEA
jgi:transcriptional regulator with XRE-family HTH domain